MSGIPAYPQPSGQPSGQPYGQMPVQQPGAYLKSPNGLAKALMVLFGLVIAADLFAILTEFGQLGVVGRIIDDPASVSLAEADDADALAGVAALLQSGIRIAIIVVFLCWFWRIRVNSEVFAPHDHTHRRGWTIGGWFCPIVNWWFPRAIALDCWHASTNGPRRSAALVNWWWGMFTASWVMSWLASRQFALAETPEKIRMALSSIVVSDVLSVVAGVLALLFVRRLTAMQTEKALAGPSAPPFVPNMPTP